MANRRKRPERRHVMDRSTWLVAHGVDAAAWARKYEIKPATVRCDDCGEDQTTSIPFAGPRGARGLVAPLCACGEGKKGRPPYCVVVARLEDL